MKLYDIIIVGGGLAGLTAAIHLGIRNYNVLVLEKDHYPRHKVCGEYVSNEIVPYLESLGISLHAVNAVEIDTLQLTTKTGKSLQTKLPLGGKGISRYAFDNLLYQKAKTLGVTFVFESVTNVVFKNETFTVTTNTSSIFSSALVIGAYGKRANLDKQFNRAFIHQKSSWLGIKAHYKLDNFPDNLVALHNFKGGYGGLSKTEEGAINFCYLVDYKNFKEHKDINNFNIKVVAKNPFLKAFLKEAVPVFEQPLSIAQISFHQKRSVENHILMCGDTAGLIHPLCGNGMAMAIHSAKIASELIVRFLEDNQFDRHQLETAYEKTWNTAFKQRLWMGRQLQSLLLQDNLSDTAMRLVTKSSFLLQTLIKQTHGKPIKC